MKMLEGIKVLDFTTNASGPKAATYLADYGAEVVKVEVPGGEGGRKFAFYVNGISTYACGKDRGKKSIEIKLSDPDAQKLLLDVAKDYDVIISSNKPGFLEKFGLGYEDVKKVNPGIVYAALTPFGYKPNKYSDKPSYDICAVAMSGLNAQTGERDGNPTRIGSVIGDMIGAEGFFAAIMLALFHKQRTGEGQFVDFSLVRNLVHINDTLQYHNKKGHIQYRSGNHNANMSPYGIYTGKTMSIVIGAVAPSTWNPLCDCMNRPDLKTDPEFATLPMRSKNHLKVEQIITDWLMTFDNTRDAYEMMEKAGVAVAPVMTAEEVWDDEEYNRLGWWVNFPMYPEWEGTDIISNKHCAYFADFSSIDEHPENRPANISTRIGENNYEVLEEWGKTKEEAKALLEKWGATKI
ncbi:putative uncharacterized protein [Firmicutes bacterium CAG:555]|nr:putative uncharacterized protein [Firmicutes bacterium CAG:555]